MRQWVNVAYHLGSMSLRDFKALPQFARNAALEHLNEITASPRDITDPKAWK